MTLADLPRRVVSPLGPWEEDKGTPEENQRARWRRYADKHRESRKLAVREWRARRKAA